MSNALIANQKEKIREFIDSAENIGIVLTSEQNIDNVAAALGLYLILKVSGKNVQVVSKKTPVVEVSNLVGVDKISKSFSGTTKILTISVPYREGEIEKVSYNIEDTRLNVNLFAESSGITFNEGDVQYIRKGSSPSTIITIGIGSEEELLEFADLKAVQAIHIDKDPLNSISQGILIIDPLFSSLSEIVTQLIMELNLGYDQDAFQNLMDGITYATRNFTMQTTSPFAFEAAGFLLSNGAKRKDRYERGQRREDRFPREEHFLGKRPRVQAPFDQPQRQPAPSSVGGQPTSQPNPLTNQDAFDDQKPIDEIEKLEGSGGSEIPDDWFLPPKVFKGSRKGN